MQTRFTPAQLANPALAEADGILRSCVRCGFCTATCPTYQLLGDELDGPRGRIYLIKNMLEGGGPATAPVVKHVDRCLSCLACMTTCPSGVNYMHLVDQARHHIARTWRRPWPERVLRRALGLVLPRPALFRAALRLAGPARLLARALPGRLARLLAPVLALAPRALPTASMLDHPGVFPAQGVRRLRVLLLGGCAQRVLAPQINDATIRLLTRLGAEVVLARGAGCCGALAHHLGQDGQAAARANIDAWRREMEQEGVDAIIANASGCGTMVKDYGHLLRDDPLYAQAARQVAGLARDVSEVLASLNPVPVRATGQRVAYHAACSLQHGQNVHAQPRALLAAAGFDVLEVPEGHLCCGSAGTYNLLQPELAGQLRDRKLANIARVAPDCVATGNIGCITQLAGGAAVPVLHLVELLDWATGGPMPQGVAF